MLPQILILTALPLETRAVRRMLRRLNRLADRDAPLPACEVRCVGLRAVRLQSHPRREGFNPPNPATPKIVAFVGIAGGLHPDLSVGHVVVDAPAELIAPLLKCDIPIPRLHHGSIHTSNMPIGLPAQKREIFSATGALAVDMENDIARRWAGAQGWSFIAIRGISDAAGDSLDPAIFRLVDQSGRLRPLAIAATLLRRPGLVMRLLHLSRDARLAADNAAIVLGVWLRHLQETRHTVESDSTLKP